MTPIEVIVYLVTEWHDPRVIFETVVVESYFERCYQAFTLGDTECMTQDPKIAGKPKACRQAFARVFGKRATVFDAVAQIKDSWSPKISNYWSQFQVHAIVKGNKRVILKKPAKRRRKRRR